MTDIVSDTSGGLTWPRLVAVVGVLVLGGVVTGFVAATDSSSAPSATEIVDGVEQRYDTAESYTSVVTVNATYENETDTVERSARVRVQYRHPDNYRVEVLGPEEYEGTVAATNGSVAWVGRDVGTTLVRPLNESQQDLLATANLSAAIDRLRENATISKRGTATIDGTETYVLDIRPNNESYDVNATVWVDTDDYRIHKMQTRGTKDGQTVSTTMQVESTSFGVSIHESTFQPPQDRTVVLASLNRTTYDTLDAASDAVSFPVAMPDPPAGFTAGEAVVSQQGEDTTVVATYENETTTLLVVQSERNPLARLTDEPDAETVDLGNQTASYTRMRDTGVVYWRADGRTYGVAGDLSRDDLTAVAASMTE